MRSLYFSGFCLENENELFGEYLIENDYTISGFSYGAINGFEFAYNSAAMDIRIDLIQLFSPAFFNDKDEKYKRMQLMFFGKNQDHYCQNFLNNCGFSQEQQSKYFIQGSKEQLHELLFYQWNPTKLQQMVNNGTKIEVYLGSEDNIIDANKALEFFVPFADVYFIKNKGHIL
ncbi:MAG: pimelyl-ACP methyl ester esterase BioV [Campylobacterales bacterium]|nr:pimelyl-ACP methyl ester esterase BioV [Campylobacterales bacterium]